MVAGVSLPLRFIREFAHVKHKFSLRAKETMLDAGANFVLTLSLAWAFGLAGLGSAAVLAILVPTVFLWTRLKVRVCWRLDLPRLRRLIATGMPYSVLQSCYYLLPQLSMLAIALALGRTSAGYFALSLLILDFWANIVVSGVTRVVTPHMLKQYGATGSLGAVQHYYDSPARLFSYTMPPLLAMGVLLAPALIETFLPAYAPGIEAAQVTLWGAFCLALRASLGSFLSASGQVGKTLKGYALIVPGSLAAGYALARSGYGITGVAWAGLATLMVAAGWELARARLGSGDSPRQAAAAVATLFAPLLFSILTITVLEGLGWKGPAGVSVKAAVYLLLYAPLFSLWESRFSLVRRLCRAT